MTEYQKRLKAAFEKEPGCVAVFIRTDPVVEVFEGKIAWEGEVATFFLRGHPKTTVGFAWGHQDGKDWQITTILAVPPIDSPQKAVKAAIASHAKSTKSAK